MTKTAIGVRTQPHVLALDGVRGIAILLVLFLHLGVMVPRTDIERFVFEVISAGWIGVDLFFVLSGALITGILLDTAGSPSFYRQFYLRRALRILPLYYLILIVSLYILPHFPHPKAANFARVSGDEWWYWLFLGNFRLAAAGGPQHGIMDVTWSLAIEEHFYLFWPLAVSLLTRKALVVVCFGLLVLSPLIRFALQTHGVEPIVIYVLTFTRIDGLAAGALVAIVMRQDRISRQSLRRGAVSGLAVFGAGLTFVAFSDAGLLPWDGGITQVVGYSFIALFFASAVLLVYLDQDQEYLYVRLLRSRFLGLMGALSYSLYLTHLPLRAVVRDTVLRPSGFQDWPGGAIVAQLVFYVVSGALALLVAWILYRYYERPFLALKGVLSNSTRPAVRRNAL